MAPPTKDFARSPLWVILKKSDSNGLGHALLTPLGVADTLRDAELALAEARNDDERRAAINNGNRQLRRSVPAGLAAHLTIMAGLEHTVAFLDITPLVVVLAWYYIVRLLE